MANIKQAKKRILQTAKKTEANRMIRSRMRSHVKAAEAAIASGDKDAMKATFTTAMSQLHKAVTKGIIKKNAASRKISRLAAAVKAANASS